MTENAEKTGKRAIHAIAMREAILSAAAAILAREGVESLSARRLAAAAGTSTKVIYSHFGGMPGVTTALYAHGFALLSTQLGAAVGLGSKLDAISQAYRDFAHHNPDLFDIMYGPAVAALLQSSESRAAARPSLDGVIAAFVILGADNAEDEARLFWASIHGVITLERSKWFDAEEAVGRLRSICHAFECE